MNISSNCRNVASLSRTDVWQYYDVSQLVRYLFNRIRQKTNSQLNFHSVPHPTIVNIPCSNVINIASPYMNNMSGAQYIPSKSVMVIKWYKTGTHCFPVAEPC